MDNACGIKDQVYKTIPIPFDQWLRWTRGSMLVFGTQVHGFAPGFSRRIFRAKKSSARLPSEGK